MAISALWLHKLRAILTTLGIAIGVFTVGTVTAIIEGLNTSFTNQISMMGSDVFYIDRFSWVGSYEDWINSWKRKPLSLDLAEKIQQNADMISIASPSMSRNATLKFKDKAIENVEITGVNQFMPLIEGTNIVKGRFFTNSDVRHRKSIVVIGENVRQEFFPNLDPIGENIKINGRRFTIVGLFEKKGEMLGYNMDNRVQIPYLTYTKYFGGRAKYASIAAKAIHPDLVAEAEEELHAIMRHLRGLKPQDKDDFAINQMSSIIDLYNQMTAMLWAVAIGIGSISLVVGGIGVMNIMLVTVTERTREIGIRKSIGATRRKILFQFLVESMVVCALGVLIGLASATGSALVIENFSPLAARIPANWGLIGSGTVVLVGFIFGILPANKAAKLDPIEALRV